jgi:hypothetical protein
MTCIPALVIGLRIRNSYEDFCSLSWVTVLVFFFLPIVLNSNLSYSVGTAEIMRSGFPTSYGVVYKLATPRTLMALVATWLVVKHSRKSE